MSASPAGLPTRRRPVPPAGPQALARAEDEQASRQRRRRGGVMALLLAPVLALGWLVTASPLLEVDHVSVSGEAGVPDEQVRAAVGVPLGASLVRLDVDAVRSRVAALPAVADVGVVRDWPGTLRVVVTQRTPAAVRGVAEDRWLLVDAGGVPYAEVPAPPAGTPRLSVEDPGPAPDHPPTAAALEVLGGLPRALREQVAVVGATSPSSVRLELVDGRTVVWGGTGQAARKVAAVQALLRRPGRTVDVSSPAVAVVTQ